MKFYNKNAVFFLIICWSLFTISCNSPEKEKLSEDEVIDFTNYNIKELSVNAAIKGDGKVFLLDSIKNHKIICLETSEESMLSDIDKVRLFNDKIVVLDRGMESILIFDFNGKLTGKINNRGRGPNEYLEILDFSLREDDELIFVLVSRNGYNLGVFHYSSDGKLMDDFSIPFYANSVAYFKDKLFFYSDYFSRNENDYNVNITNVNGELISSQFRYKIRDYEEGSIGIENVFSKMNDKLLYYPNFSDVVYSFDESGFVPFIRINRGSGSLNDLVKYYRDIPVMKFMEEYDLHQPTDLVLFGDYLFFSFSNEEDYDYNYLFDWKENKLFHFGPAYSNLEEAEVLVPHTANSNWLVSVLAPDEFHDLFERISDKEVIKRLLSDNPFFAEVHSKTEMDSNPCILLYELKR